jgi:hypothetical protein
MTQADWRDREAVYEIRVKGILDDSWSEWLGGLEVRTLDSGGTVLTGPVQDQAALHGLLNKIRDLGLPLLGVEKK